MPRNAFSRPGRWVLAALALLSATALAVLGWWLTRPTLAVQPAQASFEPPPGPVAPGPTEIERAPGRVSALPALDEALDFRIRVVDAQGVAVAGAEAWTAVGEARRVSDEAGILRFGREGVEVLVAAQGFESRLTEVDDEPKDLTLERAHPLDLTLRWEDGEPIAGAGVEIVVPEEWRDLARKAGLATSLPPTDTSGRCVLSRFRFGGETPRLWVAPPGAARTLVQLPEDAGRSEATSHEVRLPRDGVGLRVRVVDAEERPLANRTVLLSQEVEDTARTDDDGWATFGRQQPTEDQLTSLGYGSGEEFEPARARITVELLPGRSWWYERDAGTPRAGEALTLRAAPQPIFGRVETPAPESYLVASAVTLALRSTHDARFHPDRLEDLNWHPVREDGSFEFLDGWQGRRSLVLLRHRDHAAKLWIEAVPRGGGPVVLRAPDVCRVTIVSDSRSREFGQIALFSRELVQPSVGKATASFGIQLIPDGFLTAFDLPDAPRTLEVPRSRYEIQGRIGSFEWESGELDATGPTATLSLDVPEMMRVRGHISGSLRGPLPRLTVMLESETGRHLRSATTDDAGWFEAQVPGPAVRVSPLWSESYAALGLARDAALEPLLTPAQPVARFEIPEAVLHIVERPVSPLLGSKPVWLEALSPEGGRKSGASSFHLASDGRATLHVTPGTYRIRRSLAAGRDQRAQVTIEAGAGAEVVLDCSMHAVLALSVSVAYPEEGELLIRVRDAEGDLEVLRRVRRLDEDGYQLREVVDPGTYAVEIESRAKDAPPTDAPRDVWQGEFQAVPGAREPLRIHLR